MGLAILVPVSLAMGLCGLGAFLWTLRAGQYDDLDGAACRVLTDTEPTAGKDISDGELATEPQGRNPDTGL